MAWTLEHLSASLIWVKEVCLIASCQDAAMLEEFDDLMRSASTMKMSLTPDRLKTMEVRLVSTLGKFLVPELIMLGLQTRKSAARQSAPSPSRLGHGA